MEPYMSRHHTWTAVALVVGAVLLAGRHASLAAGDPHAYFKALVARSDFHKGYSLRPVAGQPVTSVDYASQLLQRNRGGYASCNVCDLWITYDPASDSDPEAQDAAKVVIPAFYWHNVKPLLGAAVSSSATTLSITSSGTLPSAFRSPHVIRIDDEIMAIVSGTTSMTVTRGQFGTTPAAHAAGAKVWINTNTVPNAWRGPVGTSDGHTYLFTWDSYWTQSYRNSGLTNHKTFNLISSGIWLEPGSKYASKLADFDPAVHVAELNVRGYGTLGPGVTNQQPITPRVNFLIKRGVWTRYWVRIEQRANDWDIMDMWIADETSGPLRVYTGIPLQVQNGTIEEFYVEWNTSTDEHVRGDLRDFVSYNRNIVVLRDPANVEDLLQRPLAGQAPPAGKPSAPRNVRIVR
jgi:hypothetical protein